MTDLLFLCLVLRMPPSILKRRYRQSLRLDQHSRQLLESKLSIPVADVVNGTVSCSNQSILRSRSSSKHRSRCRSRFSNRSPTAHKFLGRRSNGSVRSQIPGSILPADILLRIFHLGAEVCFEFPVVVSQVCSHWRFLALHSPRLWQVIRPDGRQYLCVKRIQRSRGQPLHIEITISSKSRITTSVLIDAHSRVGCVLPVIRQWRSLSISFDTYTPFLWNGVLSGLCSDSPRFASCAPKLQSLVLVYPANDDTKEFHLFGDYAPELRHVTLYGIRLRWSPSLFENLVSLDYTHHGFSSGHAAVQEVLTMLSVSSNNLRILSIRFPGRGMTGYSDVWFIHSHRAVELRRLRKLVIRADGGCGPPKELGKLVSKLVVPCLSTLELEAVGEPAIFSRKAVKSITLPFFGHRRLERLIIGEAWNHGRYIDGFVRSLPGLLYFIQS